jgi:succinate dehydrogenase / fumarate reductase cytochrome b subunit
VATLASRPAESGSARIPAGVPPLRAGQGNSFLWRRLHSLSGIFPIGVFLLEHFFSNAFATNANGPAAYTKEVEFLTGLPFLVAIEILFIYIPIAYHAFYGIYIWWRGDSNNAEYPFIGNWMYASQRWTGIITLVYIAYHSATMRWMGVHIPGNPGAAFPKVQEQLFGHPWIVAFYVVGIVAASWHFAYGVWLFAAKWGFTPGPKARKRFGAVCIALGLGLTGMGVASLAAFFRYPQQPIPVVVHENAQAQVLH